MGIINDCFNKDAVEPILSVLKLNNIEEDNLKYSGSALSLSWILFR